MFSVHVCMCFPGVCVYMCVFQVCVCVYMCVFQELCAHVFFPVVCMCVHVSFPGVYVCVPVFSRCVLGVPVCPCVCVYVTRHMDRPRHCPETPDSQILAQSGPVVVIFRLLNGSVACQRLHPMVIVI